MAKPDKEKNKPLKKDTAKEDTEKVAILYCPDHEEEMVLDDAERESSPVCDECGKSMVQEVRTLKKDKANKLRAKKYKKEKE